MTHSQGLTPGPNNEHYDTYHSVNVGNVEPDGGEEVGDSEGDEDRVLQQREVHHLPERRRGLDATRDAAADLI